MIDVKKAIEVEFGDLEETGWLEFTDSQQGLCLSCGNWQSGVEPDARGYRCEACREMTVYGTEELLLRMGFQGD